MPLKNLNKRGEIVLMTGSERIIYIIYIRTNVMISKSCGFVVGWSNENQKSNIKNIIKEFNYFRYYVGNDKSLCNEIQGGISMWKYQIQSSLKNIYEYQNPWSIIILIDQWIYKIYITIEPNWTPEIRLKKINEGKKYIIDHKEYLCTHGNLHTLK